MKTLYLADRIVLRDRRLAVASSSSSSSATMAAPGMPSSMTRSRRRSRPTTALPPIPFAATTPDGLWLEGVVELGNGDTETRMHCLCGLGRLEVSGRGRAPIAQAPVLWDSGGQDATGGLRRRRSRWRRSAEMPSPKHDEAADEMGVPRPSAASLRLLRGTRCHSSR